MQTSAKSTLPGRSYIYFSKSGKSQFELVTQMLLSKEGFSVGSQIKLYIEEGRPRALWCANTLLSFSHLSLYLTDSIPWLSDL